MTVDAAEGQCAKSGAKRRPGPIEQLLLLGQTGRFRPMAAADERRLFGVQSHT
jgi:hypothetical protein